MSDTNLCPVCETENALDATHCEVCGERLVPPAEGEVVPPEESVAAILATTESEEDEEDVGGFPDVPYDDEDGTDREGTDAVADPAVLYSPLSGEAYYAGSPEFEDGFGPMGEELVATPPESLPEVDLDSPVESEPASTGGFSNEFDNEDDEFDESLESDLRVDDAPPVMDRSSAAFAAAFPVKEKAKPFVEPLPVPGAVPSATLTLYVNRQPVYTHTIDTDETLIGRRDPRADAFPELDLSEWDDDAVISRKHAYLYRQNRNYTLFVVSNTGTQLNSDLMSLGDRRPLKSGDVLILGGKFAMKFEIPNS